MASYHVTKSGRLGQWGAKQEGAERVCKYFDTQTEAEAAAKRYSANTGGGEVRIHRPSGPIRDSDTVPPGHDPCPPRDRRH
jgi:hypothetical protein